MKLIKFVNGDAPQTFEGAELTAKSLSFKSRKSSSTPSSSTTTSTTSSAPQLAKAWDIVSDDKSVKNSGTYWLLDDHGKPLCVLHDIALAIPSEKVATLASVPRGVTDADVKDFDLRSKVGLQIERSRAEYGATYKTAAKVAATMMDAELTQNKRHERMKREREEVAEAVASGEAIPEKKPSKRAKK